MRAAGLPPVLTLSTAVVLVRGSAVARPLLRYLERLVSHEVAFARLGAWRAEVYADLVPRVPGPALHRRGDLLTRVVDDVDARVDGLLRGRLPAYAAWAAVAVAVAAAGLVSPPAAVALAAGVPSRPGCAPWLAARHAGRVDAATGRARAELRDAVVETVEGVEDLAARDGAAALAVPDRRSRALSRLEAGAAATAGAASALAQLGWGVAVVGVAVAAAAGRHPAETAAILLLGAVALAEPVLTLPAAAVARRAAAGARRRLTALAAQPARPVRPLRVHGGLDRRGSTVDEGRRGDRRRAHRGLGPGSPARAARARPGPPARAAGRGARRVRQRQVDPRRRAGAAARPPRRPVRLGGTDLRDLPDAVLRRTVSLVGDAADHVFATTVRENLRLARPAATDDELRAALAGAHLGRWLDGLPAGLDTWLGEGGTTISGGQRRRLAMARALLADPALLVLDEPTEGLDEQEAAALMTDLLAAATGRTVLLLTHRRDGLEHVDAVYDLVDGRLAEARPGSATATVTAGG